MIKIITYYILIFLILIFLWLGPNITYTLMKYTYSYLEKKIYVQLGKKPETMIENAKFKNIIVYPIPKDLIKEKENNKFFVNDKEKIIILKINKKCNVYIKNYK